MSRSILQKKETLLEEIKKEVEKCTLCPLAKSRTQVVFGEGNADALVMFVGEAPGEDEDRTGRPFVGKAGQLLTKILLSVGIQREEVYIANMVKCRPPGNRTPTLEEVETCFPYLEAQIAIVNPSIIVTLGSVSTGYLLNTKEPMSKLRGQWFDWRGGKRIFPMFHPSFLLRHESRAPGSPKHLTWLDIQEVKRVYDLLRESTRRM
ncbi:MAG: uracil-DNA glycosylase [Candidatus Caldatribacterium sp.]|uniref:uracil-DNA glycosylase n=1 Tax=Candidatus Caldatribacterium sp. TaxID=2282143 RepID=UPI002992DFD6|nr:uracil-DNA glycosylase [Candidatus Caldatribacterium sp.]MCX7729751.1 uracil-DNA glycosylase [Candidatus Caldatribacterium sp.]MDW8080864.1 uracil-DNA glycosylase [Candidatus Calescibacterium sp.]